MRVFMIESEKIFASLLLLGLPTRLAAFIMHGFINVSPILCGFFARAII